MTVETTIQQMFDEYPDLFSTRQECYDFLFCVLGNGYEWRRGQVVRIGDGGDDRYIPMWEEMDYSSAHPRAVQSKGNIAIRRERDEKFHNLKRENDLADGLPDIGPYDPDKRHWYPICEYSLINNVPPDVRSDWKAAVEECREMLREDGIAV